MTPRALTPRAGTSQLLTVRSSGESGACGCLPRRAALPLPPFGERPAQQRSCRLRATPPEFLKRVSPGQA
jgi:hypothetical protein